MPNTLTNFLVGVGFQVDDRSARQAESSISSVGRSVTKVGALVAGAFGASAVTTGFANYTNDLSRFADTFGIAADDVSAFGRALTLEGGSLEGFMGQLEGIERLRAGLLVGDAGFIAQAGRAGLETQPIEDAGNALEAYLAIADQFQNLNQQQRLNAASALGLDAASIRLLSLGQSEIRAIAEAQRELRPVTENGIEAAREFNEEFRNLQTNIGGVADVVSTNLLPAISDSIGGINAFIEANRELISEDLTNWVTTLSENLGSAAGAYAGFKVGGVPGALAGGLGGGFLQDNPDYFGTAREQLENGYNDAVNFASPVLEFLGLRDAPAPPPPTDPLPEVLRNYDLPLPTNQSDIDALVQRLEAAQSVRGLSGAAPQSINVTLELDGQKLDERTINVLDQQADQAIQDLNSTVGG